MMPWQIAETCAVVLIGGALVTSRITARAVVLIRPFARECGLVLGLFGLWQLAGEISVMGVAGAVRRGWWIWHLERHLRLPSEVTIQRWFLPLPTLVKAINLYYDTLHFTVMICFLIWLFARHREHYPHVRNMVAIVTAASLLIQLVPVAPPRMLTATGIIDTALLYHQSVYGLMDSTVAGQLAAMPSVHVAWAGIVGLGAFGALRSRWRWLWFCYPAATLLVVVVTANHYWADGIVAFALIALSALLQASGRRLLAVSRARRAVPGALPAESAARLAPSGALGQGVNPSTKA
jgi:hypothetical protein